METCRRRSAILLLLCCAAAFFTFAFAAGTSAADKKAPTSGSAAKPAEPPPADPLGRSTPYGTVLGFLRAVDRADYAVASSYVEGKQAARNKEQLARDLRTVLNRGVKSGLDELSKAPDGNLNDGLSVYEEKVGTATYGNESLDIVLRRTTKSDGPPIWLFTSETVLGAAAAAEQLDLSWGEALWPESFREIKFLSYPLFLLINQLVTISLLLAIAWLLTRGLLALLRPLFLRHGRGYGESALAQIKWLLFLLVFAVMLHSLVTEATTVGGRIFYASVAAVLMIVAASWLLVRMTKLVTRLRILHLQQAGMPSGIAAVELSGWLLVFVCVIAGLFLVLRSLGFEVTPVVAGLGVGGIAIAFAAQKTIENLFGTVMVVTDKAICVGDYCQAGNTEGGVESIGLRSTRIRTPERILVTIPNGQLAAMSIGNMTQRDKFLFRHRIRLGFETTAGQLRNVLAKITAMMSAHPKLEPGTIRTRLIKFGDDFLELEAYAYVLTREAAVFLEIQEELLLRIMDIIEASGTSAGLPSQAAPAARTLDFKATARDAIPQ